MLPLIAVLALAACGPEAEPGPPPAPAAAVDAEPPGARAKPASYVGRWAANPELCAQGAWVFEERRVTTAGEVSCDFTELTPVATGYNVEARCVAQAPATDETFMLTLTDPAPPQTMTVTGGPWDGAGITLVRCPAG